VSSMLIETFDAAQRAFRTDPSYRHADRYVCLTFDCARHNLFGREELITTINEVKAWLDGEPSVLGANEVIVNAVINAIGDTEGEPLGLRAATVIAAIEKAASRKLLEPISEADVMPSPVSLF